MRLTAAFVLVLLPGCTCGEPPKPTPILPIQKLSLRPQSALRPRMLLAQLHAQDGGTPTDAGEKAAEPSMADLSNYAGFSSDSLAFAATLPAAPQAPLLNLVFYSATTSTIEKVMPLDSPADRAAAISSLPDDGFPAIGTRTPLPKEVAVRLSPEGEVQLTFSGHPAGKPYKPFAAAPKVGAGQPKATSATVVAVSPDGKRAAVRIDSESKTPGTSLREFHVFSLFE